MENQYEYQLKIFVLSFVLGTLSGALFDCFKINRSINKSGKLKILLQDFLYWSFNIFCVFTIGINSDNGIRAYELLAFALGIVIYHLTISAFFVKMGIKVSKCIKRIVRFIVNILLYPVFIIMKILGKPILILRVKILGKIRLTLLRFWFKINRKVRLIFKFLRKG